MPRPYVMPDPDDRSINEPAKIVSSAHVLGLYNQSTPNDRKERVVESVQQWFEKEALNSGWEKATFDGSQCVLEVTLSRKKNR